MSLLLIFAVFSTLRIYNWYILLGQVIWSHLDIFAEYLPLCTYDKAFFIIPWAFRRILLFLCTLSIYFNYPIWVRRSVVICTYSPFFCLYIFMIDIFYFFNVGQMIWSNQIAIIKNQVQTNLRFPPYSPVSVLIINTIHCKTC